MKSPVAIQEQKRGILPLAHTTWQHATIKPEAEPFTRPEQASRNPVESQFNHDFSRLPLSPASSVESLSACPISPRRCPFGGVCHTCPVQVQTKLAMNQPGDEYEQEADRLANQLMGTEGGQLQRRAAIPVFSPGVPPIVHQVLRSPGHPLDPATRAFMEPRFGHDFSGVRVHTDTKAAESARAVNSLAYTVGRDVVFGAGQYAPQTSAGCKLMAHELTHVAQQDMDSVPKKLILGHAGDVYEREADQMAFQAHESNQSDARPVSFTTVQPGRVQGQFVTPLGAGGGFGGLLERDRRDDRRKR